MTDCLLQLALNKLHEILRGVEVVIDGGEANVCNLVDILQTVEDILSYAFRGYSLLVGCPLVFELVYDLFDLSHIHIPLVECHQDAPLYFGAVVEHLSAIGLGDEEIDEFQALEGGEPGFALLALPSPTDGLTILGHTGIDYFGVKVFTFGAAHGENYTL